MHAAAFSTGHECDVYHKRRIVFACDNSKKRRELCLNGIALLGFQKMTGFRIMRQNDIIHKNQLIAVKGLFLLAIKTLG